MSVHQCPQCGAAVEVADATLATSCAFCDSPLVLSEGDEEPVDQVVPFDVPRERAARLLSSYLASHWFVPAQLRHASRPASLDGVLVPFYAYDADARSRYSCRVGIYWYRTETYTVIVDGKPQTRTRQVRETEWFPLSGTHAASWADHLVSASTGLPEDEANELEPYDLGRARPFDATLTAGWTAEVPTIDHLKAEEIARQELARREQERIASQHLPGDTHSGLESQTELDLRQIRLVLLPVWVSAFSGPKGPVRLLVNGQTGEVVGKVPRDSTRIALVVVGILVVFTFVAFGATTCSGLMALIAGNA